MFVHEVWDACNSCGVCVTAPTEPNAAMAGVFDIDLDQPEENVSDDENEEVLSCKAPNRTVRLVTAQTLHPQKLTLAASR